MLRVSKLRNESVSDAVPEQWHSTYFDDKQRCTALREVRAEAKQESTSNVPGERGSACLEVQAENVRRVHARGGRGNTLKNGPNEYHDDAQLNTNTTSE